MDELDLLVCPHCRSELISGDLIWRCSGCGTSFRSLRGVVDLRTGDDVYLANRDDWSFALRLDDDFERLDFRGLLDRYFDLAPEIPAELRRRQITHLLTSAERAGGWLDALGSRSGGPILDLGCGTGGFLAAIGSDGAPAWGLDIAMRWLLVARKRLDEAGLGHVRLVCGCAERLPFRDRGFASIVAGDVIEHVGDQAATLAEGHRALAPGGRLFLAAPNRFSLASEPHVQVWGVGFLPRRWMAAYVRKVRNVDFRAIRTLGLGEWRRLLARSPFGGGTISAPGLPQADLVHFRPFKRGLARIYNAAVATRTGQWAARRVGPLHHVVCEKGTEMAPAPVPRSSPAIRPGSRPSASRG